MALNIFCLILGALVSWAFSEYHYSRHTGVGQYWIEELADEPGFGTFHVNITPESLSADTTKIVLHRDKSHQ